MTENTPNMYQQCKYLYNMLTRYPILEKPIRYPKIDLDSILSIHDMIYANTELLIPNIDIGYHQHKNNQEKYTVEELKNWVVSAKQYGELMNIDLQNKCDQQMKKLLNIENQKEQCKKLKMDNINKLPEDIVREIYSFLLPETRIILMLAKYPDYAEALQKLSVLQIKKFISFVIQANYCLPLYHTNSGRAKLSCLTPNFTIQTTFKNKQQFIIQLNKLINEFRNAIPKSPDDHRYFQKKVLQLLRTIVYLGYYRTKKATVVKPIKIKKPKQLKNTIALTAPNNV